ncbi:Uncharacterised protein [Vibrio cholerae]|nr:Uncharacterised protein [Vibrio cholerae]
MPVVDFPEPLSPTKPNDCPLAKVKLISVTAFI